MDGASFVAQVAACVDEVQRGRLSAAVLARVEEPDLLAAVDDPILREIAASTDVLTLVERIADARLGETHAGRLDGPAALAVLVACYITFASPVVHMARPHLMRLHKEKQNNIFSTTDTLAVHDDDADPLQRAAIRVLTEQPSSDVARELAHVFLNRLPFIETAINTDSVLTFSEECGYLAADISLAAPVQPESIEPEGDPVADGISMQTQPPKPTQVPAYYSILQAVELAHAHKPVTHAAPIEAPEPFLALVARPPSPTLLPPPPPPPPPPIIEIPPLPAAVQLPPPPLPVAQPVSPLKRDAPQQLPPVFTRSTSTQSSVDPPVPPTPRAPRNGVHQTEFTQNVTAAMSSMVVSQPVKTSPEPAPDTVIRRVPAPRKATVERGTSMSPERTRNTTNVFYTEAASPFAGGLDFSPPAKEASSESFPEVVDSVLSSVDSSFSSPRPSLSALAAASPSASGDELFSQMYSAFLSSRRKPSNA